MGVIERIVACEACGYTGTTMPGKHSPEPPGTTCYVCGKGRMVAFVPEQSRGAVDALHAIAACTHQDIPEPGSWWDLVSEIHGMARRGLDAAGGQ